MVRMRVVGVVLVLMMIAAFVFVMPAEVFAADAGELELSLNPDGRSYCVSACSTLAEGQMVIPSIYNGKPVTSIDERAFDGCSKLTSVTIPASVTKIGEYAFGNCTGLQRVDIADLNAWLSIEFENFVSNPISYAGNLYLNGELVRDLVIPDGISKIPECAFFQCTSLTSVVIAEGVTVIDDYAFQSCKNLKSVQFCGAVTEIGNYSFYNCPELTSVVLPEGVAELGNSVFARCAGLEWVSLPKSVKAIGRDAFNDCVQFEKLYYAGSDKEWNAIRINGVNETLLSAKLFFDAKVANIERQPVSVTVYTGETLKVSFSATGDGLTYKWYYQNPTDTRFRSTSTFKGNEYTVSSMDKSRDGRQIYCVVTDKYGNSVTTDTVTIHGQTRLQINDQPTLVVVANGEKAIVKINAQGDGLTYRWYYKNRGATDYTYTPTFKGNTYSVTMSDARAGRRLICRVYDQYGNVVRSQTVLISQEVYIKEQPASVLVSEGDEVKVNVSAVGDGLKYKWYYKNPGSSVFKLTGSFTGKTYRISAMDAKRSGRQIYCVITDKYGNSVTTDTVTLTMKTPLRITDQPTNVTVAEGETAKVVIAAEGDGLTYRWYYKNAGAKDYTYTDSFRGNTYSVKMTDARNGRRLICRVYDQYGNVVRSESIVLKMEK